MECEADISPEFVRLARAKSMTKIEEVARALGGDYPDDYWRDVARKAISAMETPSDGLRAAGRRALTERNGFDLVHSTHVGGIPTHNEGIAVYVYQSMIQAALKE